MAYEYRPNVTEPYRSSYTLSLANLVGAGDRAQAQAAVAGGEASAEAARAIGGGIGATLNNIASVKLKQADPQYRLEQARLKELTDQQRDDDILKKALADSGGDPESALAQLRSQGQIGVNAASKLQKQVTDDRKSKLAQLDDDLKRSATQLGQASQLLQSVPDPTPDPETGALVPHPRAAEAYAAIAPKIKALVGEQLAAHVPDQYDPAVVDQMRAWGETAQQHLERVKAGLDLGKLAVDHNKDVRERDAYYTKSLGTLLSTTRSQDEWDHTLQIAKDMGAPAATIAKFGSAWSADAATRAGVVTMTPEERAKLDQSGKPALGSPADFIATYAKELGKAPETLTSAEKAVAVRHHAEAQRDPTAAARLAWEQNPFGPAPTAGAPSTGAAGGGSVPPGAAAVAAGAAAGATAGGAAASGTASPSGRNEAALKNLPPPVAAQVKAIVDGRRALDPRTASSPVGRALLNAAYAYDPSFDQVNYNARYKTRTDFTSGAAAKNINALNTVIGHLDELSTAADALNNSRSPMWNSIANAASSAAGNPQVKKFETIQNAVADEATRVWRQAGGTESDIKAWKKDLDSAGSPEQLHGVIATIGDLLSSKLEALQTQYQQGMGATDIKVITPQAEKTLSTLRGKVSGAAPAPVGTGAGAAAVVSVTSPSWKTFSFKTQAEADAAVAKAKAAGLWK